MDSHFKRVLRKANKRPKNYPMDLPGAVRRAIPSFKIPLQLANPQTLQRDCPVMVDCDESGLIAIHSAMENSQHGKKYTVTHPPSGVAYMQDLPFVEALDLSNWLAANLHRIEQLELDYTTNGNRPRSCRIVSDPGDVNGLVREWEDLWDTWKKKRRL